MTKQEFLSIFELEEIYNKYKDKLPFCFSLHDRLLGSDNAVYFSFKDDKELKIHIECREFNVEIQHLEISLILNDFKTELNQNEKNKNEIFPFLNFDMDLDTSLNFISGFVNKVLKQKYQLMGGVKSSS